MIGLYFYIYIIRMGFSIHEYYNEETSGNGALVVGWHVAVAPTLFIKLD